MYYETTGDVPSGCRLEVVDVATARKPADDRHLIRKYLGGQSVKSLASDLGVSRGTVERILSRHGITRRGLTEANQMMMTGRSPEENSRNAEAAHAAVRGRRQTAEHRAKIARSRHGKPSGSALEMLYAAWLADLGPVHQFAVGPYNCDLMIEPVAVEVFGGHWHGGGKHAARAARRSQHILDQGYNLVIIWVTGRSGGARVESADYVRAFVQESRRDPSLRGQYRVIWGYGEPVPGSGDDLSELTRVPPGSGRRHRR
jgi:hypothetical protein